MIIRSLRGTHRATLTPEGDELRVVVTRTADVRFCHDKHLCNSPIDAPFHVVADYLADLVQDLEDKEWTNVQS